MAREENMLLFRIEDGVGWTFGFRGALKLKGNLRAIRIERLPKAAK